MKALRVPVVEDNATIGMLLGEMRAEMGHHACGVEPTEAEAVAAAAARYKSDMMSVDAHLGDGSGVAAMRTILRIGPMPHLRGIREGIAAYVGDLAGNAFHVASDQHGGTLISFS
jgi:CheY-like chemotaxis protein